MKFLLIFIFLVSSSLFSSPNTEISITEEEEFKKLIAKSKEVIRTSMDIPYAKELRSKGNKILPYLFEELKGGDEEVSDLMAYVIKDFNKFTEEQTNILMKVDNSWYYETLAKNNPNSNKIIKFFASKLKQGSFVTSYLNKDKFLHEVFKQYNCKGIKEVTKIKENCRKYFKFINANIIGRNFDNKKAIKVFIKILENKNNSKLKRIMAIKALLELKSQTINIKAIVKKLLKKSKDKLINYHLNDLILELSNHKKIHYYEERLRRNKLKRDLNIKSEENKSAHSSRDIYYMNNYKILESIVMQEIVDYELGESIIKYINWKNIEEKIYAIKALGFLKHKNADLFLIKFLKKEKNIRVIFYTVDTLIILNSKRSIPTLKQIKRKSKNKHFKNFIKNAIFKIKNNQKLVRNKIFYFSDRNLDYFENWKVGKPE